MRTGVLIALACAGIVMVVDILAGVMGTASADTTIEQMSNTGIELNATEPGPVEARVEIGDGNVLHFIATTETDVPVDVKVDVWRGGQCPPSVDTPVACPGDMNGDNVVGIADWGEANRLIRDNWGNRCE
jgi:hypothetical protein